MLLTEVNCKDGVTAGEHTYYLGSVLGFGPKNRFVITEGTLYPVRTNRYILYGKVAGKRRSVHYNRGYVISESVITEVLLYMLFRLFVL